MPEKPKIRQVAPILGSAAANGEMVTVFIGPTRKRYSIYKDLICHHSEYFRVAFNGLWQESDKGLTLEDVEIEVFNLFVHWLYTQELPKDMSLLLQAAGTDAQLASEDSEYSHWGILLLKSCIFGDRFFAPDFHRLSHNVFVDGHFPGKGEPAFSAAYKTIIWSFSNLPEGNPVLSMMVDLQCLAWNAEDDNEEEKQLLPQLPHEFLVACMLRQSVLKTLKTTDDKLKACDYYM
ncbi:hypothetical protein AA0113_g5373 [Alternaria arborescens]|uniref:BTB domain-containing protein n=1 Tax=Alternaria arborescens TaxID=156630 RepID=A0A4Q4S6J6_9PLEO|nr:hypothetical protein AA0112_g10294 [Alternaria arborescens]RYO65369.1 hypothetical protein AA0113_g5373 [Alternaria arborescens]